MLYSARVTAFTFSELLEEYHQGEGSGGKSTTLPTQIRFKDSEISKKIMFSSKCAVCNSKKSRFIKNKKPAD